MASLNAKSRTNFEQWLADIDENDLRVFVYANTTDTVNFGSDDFKLIHWGISDGEPIDCYMIEARINGNTKDKQLKKLLKTTGSLAKDRTRLALQALRESPVKGQNAVNKVHVQWSSNVRWEDGKLLCRVDAAPFLFEKIPFQGYKVGGTAAPRKEKGKK